MKAIDFSDVEAASEVDLDFSDHRLRYENLQLHQKKFWDVVEHFLQMGVTPTPRVVNEALGKHKRTSWNGPLCRIRRQLLIEYGYELVPHEGFRGTNWRWEKKDGK